MRHKLLILILLIIICDLQAQNNKTTFGLQYKPIVPSKYFNSSHLEKESGLYSFKLDPQYSYSLGMVLRHKINKTFSAEYGMNYIQRNYKLLIDNKLIINDFTSFGIRSYEIPFQLLTYVQASKLWYVNVAFGLSHNILTSDILSYGFADDNFIQNTYRKNSSYVALLANIGMEYRTADKGCYYFGTSLHRPWKELARIYPEYKNNFNDDIDFEEKFFLELIGTFITLDIRYFFSY